MTESKEHTDLRSAIQQRIDTLSASRRLWTWVMLISAGGFFEIYDMALTAPLSAALVGAGIFHTGSSGLFGFADQASFIFATFSGLYLGVVAFSLWGDRLGRRSVFAISLIWYAIATLMMGLQDNVTAICIWRFVSGIGLGAEAVAINCYIVELVPARMRGKTFAISMAAQYLGIPAAAFLAAILAGTLPLGIEGWRWLTFIPVSGAAIFWFIRRTLPESPRWLAQHGRFVEASNVLDLLDVGLGEVTETPEPARAAKVIHVGRRYMIRVTIMMLVYFNLQATAYYGFAHWLPTLLQSQGVELKSSLFYSAGVAISAPIAPLLLSLISDKFERKHLILASGLSSIFMGLSFAFSHQPIGWITFGIGLAVSNSILSVNSHNYLSELFPTRNRARMVGFLYSFTRIAAAVSGYIFAFVLERSGMKGVFTLITVLMVIAVGTVALIGPRTSNVTFEDA